MFDFEKLEVYQVARSQNARILKLIFRSKGFVDSDLAGELYNNYEQISKMLLALYRSVGK